MVTISLRSDDSTSSVLSVRPRVSVLVELLLLLVVVRLRLGRFGRYRWDDFFAPEEDDGKSVASLGEEE